MGCYVAFIATLAAIGMWQSYGAVLLRGRRASPRVLAGYALPPDPRRARAKAASGRSCTTTGSARRCSRASPPTTRRPRRIAALVRAHDPRRPRASLSAQLARQRGAAGRRARDLPGARGALALRPLSRLRRRRGRGARGARARRARRAGCIRSTGTRCPRCSSTGSTWCSLEGWAYGEGGTALQGKECLWVDDDGRRTRPRYTAQGKHAHAFEAFVARGRADRALLRHALARALRACTAATCIDEAQLRAAAQRLREPAHALGRAAQARDARGARSSSRPPWSACRSPRASAWARSWATCIAGAAIGPWGLGLIGDVESTHAPRRAGRRADALRDRPRARSAAADRDAPARSSAAARCSSRRAARCSARRCSALGLAWQAALVGGPRARALVDGDRDAGAGASATSSPRRPGASPSAILLFQDIAAIPLIALVPLLGHVGRARAASRCGCGSALAVAAIAGVDRHRAATSRARRCALIAKTELRELFTAFALLLVIGIAELMHARGAVDGAGRLPRRRAARGLGIPPRARRRHRAVQGTAAGPLLHLGGHDDRLRAAREPPRHGRAAARGIPRAQDRRALRRVARARASARAALALRVPALAGRRVRASSCSARRATCELLTPRVGGAAHDRRGAVDGAPRRCCSSPTTGSRARRAARRARGRHDRRDGPGDHRGLRALRADRRAPAARERRARRGARPRPRPDRVAAQVRLPGVLRRCDAAGPAARRPAPTRRACW